MNNEFQKIAVISIGKNTSLSFRRDLNEFMMLLKELKMENVLSFSQDIKSIDKSTYVGKGKIFEIAETIHLYNKQYSENKIDLLACNFELTGLQKKNIEAVMGIQVVDRTFILLDIFQRNARSKEALLQVEIARLCYMSNHLIDEKASYSQVSSGSGHNKGKGEKQIELSRRQIAMAINKKKKDLLAIKLARRNSRTKRNNNPYPKVCIVGYTNAGKSTLMNRLVLLSKNDKTVLEKDALFATLETSTRAISVYGYPSFFLTDTVGFVSSLPKDLIEAFHSTLEEIKEADLLVQVIDMSDPFKEDEIKVTKEIIKSLDADNIPLINIYNKYDLLERNVDYLPQENEMFVSLLDENDVDDVLKLIATKLSENWQKQKVLLPYEIDFATFNKQNYVVSYMKEEKGIICEAYINPAFIHLYRCYFLK